MFWLVYNYKCQYVISSAGYYACHNATLRQSVTSWMAYLFFAMLYMFKQRPNTKTINTLETLWFYYLWCKLECVDSTFLRTGKFLNLSLTENTLSYKWKMPQHQSYGVYSLGYGDCNWLDHLTELGVDR